jgi:SAM-dependent methyltransferase
MSRLTKLRALKWPTVAYEIQKNLRSRARGRRDDLSAITAVGSTLEAPASRVAYSRTAFEGFLERGALDPRDLESIRLLELGPGQDLSVSLRFLAAGAAHATCVDRFTFNIDPAWEREVYRLLLEDLDEAGRRRLDDVVTPAGELRAGGSRIELLSGLGIEDAAGRLPAGSFDLIVSVAVLEHVHDLASSMRAMDVLLAAGGRMVHQVDLRDHGMFSGGGRHPLEFLTIPEAIYGLMTSHTGAPNRERIATYRRLLKALGHDSFMLVTNVGGAASALNPYRERIEVEPGLAESIERMRSRLAPRFAGLPLEELAITGIVFRSRKPRARS